MKTGELVIGGVLLSIGLVIGVLFLLQAEAMQGVQRELNPDEYRSNMTGAVVGFIIATFGVVLTLHGLASKNESTAPTQTPKVSSDTDGICAYFGASIRPTDAWCATCGKKVVRG